MNPLGIFQPLRIRTRLWILVALIVGGFLVVGLLVGDALRTTQRLASEAAALHVSRVADNSEYSRALSSVSRDIELLSRTFSTRPERLAEDSRAIGKALDDIASSTAEGALRLSLDQLAERFWDFVRESAAVIASLVQRSEAERAANDELAGLEQLISALLIETSLAGRGTAHVEQLLGLVTGYRESLSRVAEVFVDQDRPGSPGRAGAGNEGLGALDDLYLRLQVFTASTPEVSTHGRRLATVVERYRRTAQRLDERIEAWNHAAAALAAAEARARALMAGVDAETVVEAAEVGKRIEAVIGRTLIRVAALALLVIGLVSLVVVFLVRRHIDVPLETIVRSIATMSNGRFNRPISLNREDEWGTIEAALNRLGGELAGSYKALEASEARYRLLVENQNDLVVKVDPDGRFLFVSPTYCEVFGKREDELLGRTFMPLVHEDDRAATANAMKALYVPPYTTEIEQRAMTRNGWRWLAWSDRAVLDEKGKVIAIIGVGRDVTARKQAEERVLLAASVFNNTPEGISITDPQGVIIDVNDAFTRITGYTRAEVLDRNHRDLAPEHHTPVLHGEMWNELETTGYWTGRVPSRRRNGEDYVQLLNISVVRDPGGRTQHYVHMFSDVTSETAQ